MRANFGQHTARGVDDVRGRLGFERTYVVGNHGAELLRPGSTDVLVDEAVEEWTGRVRAFADGVDTTELQLLRVRRQRLEAVSQLHARNRNRVSGPRPTVRRMC